MYLTIKELLDYTGEERDKWKNWFAANGDDALKISLASETHPTTGALILHCFWAELFYSYFMRGQEFTRDSEVVKENQHISNESAAQIFEFGQMARNSMQSFIETIDQEEWERVHSVEAGAIKIEGSARKLISHILIHEVRHWAQLAIVMRLNGLTPPGNHDLVFSDSFGPLIKKV